MDDAISFRKKHPSWKHIEVPWDTGHDARLLRAWRTLLESQNGEGVDGSELPSDGGRLGAILRTLIPATYKRLLILGAGRGQEVEYARSHGYDVTGFTLGSMNPAVAKEAFGLDLRFEDAHVSPLATATFDAVVGLQVLEHSPAPLLMLLECGRLLRPGGIAVFETPSGKYHTGGGLLHHVLCPTARQALGLMQKAGFNALAAFGVGEPITEDQMDRGDLPFDLLFTGKRMSATELRTEAVDPITRKIVEQG